MRSLASFRPATRRRATSPPRSASLLAASAVLVLLLILWFDARSGPVAARQVPRASTQPMLVILPHASGITGMLTGGASLRGTLAPSMPGANTVRLAVRLRSGTPVTAGSLTLTASMPGMVMAPITAVLHAYSGAFTGTVRLPMFGDYLAVVALSSPQARSTGTITLSLPLPRLED